MLIVQIASKILADLAFLYIEIQAYISLSVCNSYINYMHRKKHNWSNTYVDKTKATLPKSDVDSSTKGKPMNKQTKAFAPTALNIAVADSIVQSLDALSLARENWEQTTFKKANEGLYDLLAQSLEVFETKFVKATKDDQKTLRQEVIDRLTLMKVKTQKNSPTLSLFVRLVFCSDRKRAHGYGYVLNAAISHGINATQLPEWIVTQGGIEEIKRNEVKSDEAIARKQKRETAKETAEQLIIEAQVNPLATVGVDGFMPTQRNIMLAVGDVNGNFNVTYVLTEVSDGLYNALLKQAAKKIVEADEKDNAMTIEASNFKQKPAANEERTLKAA